jgi:hypothetical protein
MPELILVKTFLSFAWTSSEKRQAGHLPVEVFMQWEICQPMGRKG